MFIEYNGLTKKIGAGLVLLGMVACSSTPEQQVNQADGDTVAARKAEMDKVGYRCDKIKTTGSNIAKKHCSTSQQREQERKDSEAYVREVKRISVTPVRGN